MGCRLFVFRGKAGKAAGEKRDREQADGSVHDGEHTVGATLIASRPLRPSSFLAPGKRPYTKVSMIARPPSS